MYVKKLSELAIVPSRKSTMAAGYDLYSAYNYVLKPNRRVLVKTDIGLEIPEGYYGRIASRSGISLKYGVEVGAGVVDSDYRGNIGIILYNHGDKEFNISRGDRVAQIIITKICSLKLVKTDNLKLTLRNGSGFGSTGKK